MQRFLTGVAVAVLALSASCGGDDDKLGTSPFGMTSDEIRITFDTPTMIGTNVSSAISEDDEGLFLAQFAPGSAAIDPFFPDITPGLSSWFNFVRTLCDPWGLRETFVNVGGALSVVTCRGYYEDFAAAGLPETVTAVRHLPIAEGQATELMHRVRADVAGSFPEETVRALGFAPDRSVAVSDQAAQAIDLRRRFERAWNSSASADLAALYAPAATRHDAYVGERSGVDEITAWITMVRERYQDVSMTIESLYVSGRGPAAIYELTMRPNGETCTMRLASVWDLNAEDLVDREFVYYDVDTVFSCAWAG